MCSDKLIYPDQIEQFCIAVVPVGSRVTCNPPPTDTDQDLLCFLKEEDYDILGKWLEKKGWEYEDCYRLQGDFMSYRKDHWNIIATCDEKFFDNFVDATKSCKSKNLLDKKDRIAEFGRVFGQKKKLDLSPTYPAPLDAGLVYQQEIDFAMPPAYYAVDWHAHYQQLFNSVANANNPNVQEVP